MNPFRQMVLVGHNTRGFIYNSRPTEREETVKQWSEGNMQRDVWYWRRAQSNPPLGCLWRLWQSTSTLKEPFRPDGNILCWYCCVSPALGEPCIVVHSSVMSVRSSIIFTSICSERQFVQTGRNSRLLTPSRASEVIETQCTMANFLRLCSNQMTAGTLDAFHWSSNCGSRAGNYRPLSQKLRSLGKSSRSSNIDPSSWRDSSTSASRSRRHRSRQKLHSSGWRRI